MNIFQYTKVCIWLTKEFSSFSQGLSHMWQTVKNWACQKAEEVLERRMTAPWWVKYRTLCIEKHSYLDFQRSGFSLYSDNKAVHDRTSWLELSQLLQFAIIAIKNDDGNSIEDIWNIGLSKSGDISQHYVLFGLDFILFSTVLNKILQICLEGQQLSKPISAYLLMIWDLVYH